MANDRPTSRRDPPSPRARPRRVDTGGQALEQRRHPRFDRALAVRLFRPGTGKAAFDFQAHVKTEDISVGGIYVASTFFLRRDIELEVELKLPDRSETVRANGTITRVLSDAAAAREGKSPGFAIRFEAFEGDSEILLRAFLARGDVRQFVEGFAKQYLPKVAIKDHVYLIEMLVRWEMLQERLANDD